MTTNTKIKLTKAQAIELLDRAVEEKGADYVYPRDESEQCYYLRDGQPSCIVGHVLIYAGFTAEDLAEASIEGLSAWALDDYLPLEADRDTLTMLSYAQGRQDQGHSWGDAVLYAKQQPR